MFTAAQILTGRACLFADSKDTMQIAEGTPNGESVWEPFYDHILSHSLLRKGVETMEPRVRESIVF